MFEKLFSKFNNKTLKPLLLKVVLSFLFVLIFFIISLITLKNIFSYSLIENNLSKYLGLKIELISPKTKFNINTNINLKAKYINIYDKDKQIQFISIENPDITFKPLGFLFSKINFKKIDAKNININIKRDNNGKVDLLEATNLKELSFLNKKQFQLTRLKSNISYIKFNFKDDYKIKNEATLNLLNTDIDISKRHKKLYISESGTIDTFVNSKKQTANININISSKYPTKNFKSDDLYFDIDINNINLFMFNNIFKKELSKDIESTSGNAEIILKTNNKDDKIIHNLIANIENPTLKLLNGKTISPYKKGISIKSQLLIDKELINIENLTLKSNNLLAISSGTITKPFNKKRTLNLSTKIKDTQLNNFVYFLPDDLIYFQLKGIPTLKKSNFHGLINGDINLKLFPLDITGNVKVSNVHIPSYPKSFVENDVNLIFMKDKMRVYTRVYTPANEYIIIDGISNLDNSLYGKYSVKSTSNIDLAFAKLYLVPIQQIIGFNIGPIPIMDISGYGNIDIKTQGTIKDAQIFGEFNAKNASARLDGLDAKLTNGDCKLIFDDRTLIFKEIKGQMDGASFILTGKGDTKGNVNLNAKLKDADTNNILKVFNNSLITKPYAKLTENILSADGKIAADINLIGTISDYENKEFLSKLVPSGEAIFKNNNLILKNKTQIKKINGAFKFGEKQSGFFEAFINNSKIIADFNSSDSLKKISNGDEFNFKSNIYSNKISFNDIMEEINKSKKLSLILPDLNKLNFYSKFNIKSEGKISINKLDLSNIKHHGYIIGLNNKENKNIKFNSGIIKFNGAKIIFENFDTSVIDGRIKIKGSINNFLSKTPDFNVIADLNNLSLMGLDKIFPKIKISKGKLKNGQIILKNDTLKLNSFSASYEDMPIFINASLKDIYNSKILDAHFSTILNEYTNDCLINPYLTYPIKIKGEVPLKGNFKGKNDNYIIDFSAIIPQYADIHYSGANIGDVNHKREITGKIEVYKNKANINNLRLVKHIKNQNGKVNPLTVLKANGKIIENNKNFFFDNFKITTTSPINVRVLNLIFKKSILKQGNFECNLNLKDNIKSPKINGKVVLQDLDIPLYDTQINNIKVNISDKFVDGEILAKNNKSDLRLLVKAENKTTAPYIINNVSIESTKLDISEILNSVKPTSIKTDINKKTELALKPEDVIIKNGTFDFKEVLFEKIQAQNLKGNFNYKNNIFNLEDILIDIAEGKFNANGKYSLKTTQLDLNAKMEDCNSNTLTKEFLQLSDQIFGKINGSIKLSGRHLNTSEAIKNIKTEVSFSIDNGKMPKLGSLEYLLRAGNLIKNGILGLSLNNVIQVLTPYKTGEFEKISGTLSIKNAEVNNLEILSQGKNLSLYLKGTYSIFENFADIKIYGKLSQNIGNALGKVGNASINQFINSITSKKNKLEDNIELKTTINKIPRIEIENPEPRFFKVKVLGDINKENYIKNFSWL